MQERNFHPALNLLLVSLTLLWLYIGKNLMIPLVMAIVVWYLINSIGAQIGRIPVLGNKLSQLARTALSLLVVFGFFWFIGGMVVANLEEFNKVAPEYNERLQNLSQQLSQELKIPTFDEISEKIDFAKAAQSVFNSSFAFLTAFFVVVFYVVFLMLEQSIFRKKLDLIFTNKRKKIQFFQIIERIDISMKAYLSVKTFISFTVAFCAYFILLGFGVDFAILWAFLTFLLNFIPFVGSFVAVLLPSVLSLLQFGEPLLSVTLFAVLMGVQVVMGNVIEPRMVGKSLNLSPLVVVLSLAFWGALWGVAGMFLCVPITVALMIIFSQFPSTRPIAILLSAGNDPSEYKRTKRVDPKSPKRN